MDNYHSPGQKPTTQILQRRLEQAGLGELAGAFARSLKPLAPLIAQLLWFAQPGFALFGQADAIDALASDLMGDAELSSDHANTDKYHA